MLQREVMESLAEHAHWQSKHQKDSFIFTDFG